MSGCNRQIGDRKYYVSIGDFSWTVNICTPANRRGEYDWVVRMPIVTRSEQLEAQIGEAKSTDDAVHLLKDSFEGKIERAPGLGDIGREETPKPETRAFDTETVDWLKVAVSLVEQTLDELVEEFLEMPFLHRVEHSLHMHLARLLWDRKLFQVRPVLTDKTVTQLVHKEWPETSAQPNRRRGNFDLALFAPSMFRSCSRETFRHGGIRPPIAIEVGLDYRLPHLIADIEKLNHSCIEYGYVVHFTRDGASDRCDVEEAILRVATRVKVAYVARHAGIARFKKVTSQEIIERKLVR